MKKSILTIAFILLLASGVKAQNNNQLSLQISLNQIELGYQHSLFSDKLWGEAFAGTGNQDINGRFDDLLAGVRVGYIFFAKKRDLIGLQTSFGIYFPNNDYYSVVTPVIGAGIRYSRSIGKSNHHNLLVNAGYQYGKRDYKQDYSSETLNVTTIGTFKIAPLYFSLGYGFNF